MNKAQELGLMAKLAYLLMSRIKSEASDDLKTSLHEAKKTKSKPLLDDDFRQDYVGRFKVEDIRKKIEAGSDFDLSAYFENANNKSKHAAILSHADLFAEAAREIGAEKFAQFLPDEAFEEETAFAISEHDEAFPELVKDLILIRQAEIS